MNIKVASKKPSCQAPNVKRKDLTKRVHHLVGLRRLQFVAINTIDPFRETEIDPVIPELDELMRFLALAVAPTCCIFATDLHFDANAFSPP